MFCQEVEIEAHVLCETMLALRQMADNTDLSVGEVIDRLALHICPKKTAEAVHIALEEIGIVFSKLNEADAVDAVRDLISLLTSCLPEENRLYS